MTEAERNRGSAWHSPRREHRRLQQRLVELTPENEKNPIHQAFGTNATLGVMTSGAIFMHVREAIPDAST
jgi:TPP-dependent indolepyruvate ferredoxin oxidoreductase alpha subunit